MEPDVNPDEQEEKARLISQVLELQNTLDGKYQIDPTKTSHPFHVSPPNSSNSFPFSQFFFSFRSLSARGQCEGGKP